MNGNFDSQYRMPSVTAHDLLGPAEVMCAPRT